MSAKTYKKLVRFLGDHGYEFDRTNARGIEYFRHPASGELWVNPGLDERAARQIEHGVLKSLGIKTVAEEKKRNVAQIKEREAGDRARAAAELARLDADRDQLVLERDADLARFGVLSTSDMRAIIAKIEANERERRYWASLMTETPTSGHEGVKHAAHRA